MCTVRDENREGGREREREEELVKGEISGWGGGVQRNGATSGAFWWGFGVLCIFGETLR